jgi:predicted SprT family Zn-dependent metalloprotease
MTMQQRILDKVEESFKKAEAFYGRTFSRPQNIIFKRSGTTAGHSCYARKELMFQIALAEKEGDNFINRTPAHEVAHYIDDEVYGNKYVNGRRQIHGARWKFIMTHVMKQEASRCHSFDTSAVKGKRERIEYYCANGHNLNISSVIHNRIIAGNKRGYRCKCGGKLTPKNLVDIVNKESEIEKLKRQIAQLQANQNHV